MNTFELLKEEALAGNRVLLVGPPGCGKTARIARVAQEIGARFLCTPLHMKERADLSGVIVPDMEKKQAIELPLDLLALLRSSRDKILWLIDDLGKADITVQGAIKSLITRYGVGHSLPDNVLVWGATNRSTDGAGANAIDESLRSEFDCTYAVPMPIWKPGASEPEFPSSTRYALLGTYQDEVNLWVDWALETAQAYEAQGDPDRADWIAMIASFHATSNGQWLYRWMRTADASERFPDYRAWGSVMLMPKSLRNTTGLQSRIGSAAAAALMGFADVVHDVPTREEVIMSPLTARVPDPEKLNALYYLSTLLPTWVEGGRQALRSVIRYMGRLPRQYAALVAKSITKKAAFHKIATMPEWQEWFRQNQDLFDVEDE
ncbi:MAG: ATP-binding protein [Candidatus Bilamarchaeaceae archaeon]